MQTTLAKKLADSKGLSGLRLSYAAHVSQPDVSRYLRGERRPHPAHARRIADALAWPHDPAMLFEPVDETDAAEILTWMKEGADHDEQ